jgi:hypothetical protein
VNPSRVVWSAHAEVKAAQLSASVADIEERLLRDHARRTRNAGAARWQVRVGPWVIAYDHPADNDPTLARIVTLWRP